MKSSLKNMVLSLLVITFVAGAVVGTAYSLTKEPIAAAKRGRAGGALGRVLGDFDNDPSQDTVSMVLDGMPVTVHIGKKGGAITGYAVETMTRAGYNGEIRMMVGFLPSGEISNIEVIEHNETPGLGSKIADPGNPLLLSFTGKNPSNLRMSVRTDGGDIDGITASTISSRAYIDAVQRAYAAFQAVALGVDAQVDHIAAVLGEYGEVSASAEIDVDGSPAIVNVVQRDGGTIGYAVQAETENGYHGTIRLMVGFLPDGTINDIAVMEQNETPGFGAAITMNPDNELRMSFKGRKAGEFKFALKAEKGDVDAISGSTITSQAYVEAVKRAYQAWVLFKKEEQSHE